MRKACGMRRGMAWERRVARAGATPAARITFVDKYAGAGTGAGAACRIWPLSLAIVVICQISERPPALRDPLSLSLSLCPTSHGRTRLHCCQARRRRRRR